ncbi:MAG TPA: hypothetical protein VEI96_04615 [Thermodesulfovibrionales bacterium]|nr:hypothetical protein [Thermodesulfovibrionales bacterium]
MKRLCLIGVILLLALPCLAWGGDIDGIWSLPDGGAVMMRENGGTVIALQVSLPLLSEGYANCVLQGTQVGNSIILSNLPSVDYDFCGFAVGLTITLTSPTTGTLHVDFCKPTIVDCFFDSGLSLSMEKIF